MSIPKSNNPRQQRHAAPHATPHTCMKLVRCLWDIQANLLSPCRLRLPWAPRRHQMDHPQVSKKIRRPGDMIGVDSSATSSSLGNTATNPAAAITLDTLPAVALSHIVTFAQEGHLSGACRSTLEAIRELHYKIDIRTMAVSFSVAEDPSGALSSGHMGLQPSGALATGRVVARITVTGCTDYKKTKVRTALFLEVQ